MHATLLSLAALGVGAASVQAGYAPTYRQCSTNATIRLQGSPQGGNQTLNPQEASYIESRRPVADAALKSWLSNGNLTSKVYGGDFGSVNSSSLPTISIALSGGGNRAALYGAGVLNAMDSRNSSSVAKGTGGLLQASTYLSGLSGGSWLLSSFLLNDMPQVYDMVLGDGTNSSTAGWKLKNDFFAPGNSNQSAAYVAGLFNTMAEKSAAGFPITINDPWALALAYHFTPGTSYDNFFDDSVDHGRSLLLSSAPQLSSMQNYSMPFPIIVTNTYTPNTKDVPVVDAWVPLSNVVYEVTPFEFGSYDPELAASVPLEYLGTRFNSGTVVNATNSSNGSCVQNFDNAAYLLGISSNVFHAYNVSESIAWTSPVSPINQLWTAVNSTFYQAQPGQQIDVAAVPSPFQGLMASTYEDSNQTQLRLVDGGYNGEVDPIQPLVVMARKIDVIVVADATADSAEQMPTGASLVATEERASVLPAGTISLPPLPNSNTTYVSQGLNTKATFFGCQGTAANLSGKATESPYPMMVYLPNYDPTGVTNTSTGQLVYPDNETSLFLDTATNIAQRGRDNDNEFATCLACAVVERTRGREGVDRTATCNACMTKYCWDEKEAATTSSGGNGTTSNNGTTGGATGSNGTSTGGSRPASGVAGAYELTGVKSLMALVVAGVATLLV